MFKYKKDNKSQIQWKPQLIDCYLNMVGWYYKIFALKA